MFRVAAFTLIELMVVIGILAALAGMLMPIVTMAQRGAMRTSCEATLRKIDVAARMFRRDIGIFPYQLGYPDQVDRTNPFTNRLARQLARGMIDSERDAVRTLAATAAGKYAYTADLNDGTSVEASLPSTLAFSITRLPPRDFGPPWIGDGDKKLRKRYSYFINRLAGERAGLCMLAGAFDMTGGIVSGPYANGAIHSDLSGNRVVTSSEIGSLETGWGDDYLRGEIEARFIDGDAILDAYRHPVIYVCQLVPRIRSTSVKVQNSVFSIAEPSWFGLGHQGFASRTGPWGSIVSEKRFQLLGLGRVVLTTGDAGDGQPPPTDPTFYPTAGDFTNSDRRYYAAPSMGRDFELWSAGRDGSLRWMRNDPLNRDNIPANAYDRKL